MSIAAFVNLIEQYADYLGVGNIPIFNEEQVYLECDPELLLEIRRDSRTEKVQLSILCVRLQPNCSPDLLLDLMNANYYWSETAGATLSIHKTTNFLYLIDVPDASVVESVESFASRIDVLLQVAEKWRSHVLNYPITTNSQLSSAIKDDDRRVGHAGIAV